MRAQTSIIPFAHPQRAADCVNEPIRSHPAPAAPRASLLPGAGHFQTKQLQLSKPHSVPISNPGVRRSLFKNMTEFR